MSTRAAGRIRPNFWRESADHYLPSTSSSKRFFGTWAGLFISLALRQRVFSL